MCKKNIIFFFVISVACKLFSTPCLLIKIPTRSRPEAFFQTLDSYYRKLSHHIPYYFLISCDSDDTTMNNDEIKKRFSQYKNLTAYYAPHKNKVDAYNSYIDKIPVNWDILLVTSDDMEPLIDGFDEVISEKMVSEFPDFDGVLNFNDGHVGSECNTLPILGKKYYERFGYIYHPTYASLFCDEELTLVSKMLRKEKVCNEVIIRHNHPVFGLRQWDDLYVKNESFKHQDRLIFDARRAHYFDIPQDMITAALPKTWSILICTLEERIESFNHIYTKLLDQVKALNLEHEIEILFLRDNRALSVGYKRNYLLQHSQGKYVCFVDDDDDVHENYIKMIYEKLHDDVDCVSLQGIISHRGQHCRLFIHSLAYTSYFQKDLCYYRPPNHLNPMKRVIAIQFTFPESYHGEDLQWTTKLTQSKLLKTEALIDEPYYFYRCSDNPLSRYY